jgi:hypothetical protein
LIFFHLGELTHLGVVLVDPEIGPRFYAGTDEVDRYDEYDFKVQPFQMGYVDFIEPDIEHIEPLGTGSYYRDRPANKLSPLKDLVHYWYHYSNAKVQNLRNPTPLAIMKPAFQIAASEFVVAIEAMKASLGIQGYGISMKSPPARLEQYLNEATLMDRILAARIRQVEAAKSIIADNGPQPGTQPDPILDDYEYLASRMRDLRDTCSARLNSITTMISLLDSRLAGRLSWAALIFAPLAYAAGLLSLGGDFAPGAPLFWVYWVISGSFLLVVLVVLYALPLLLPALGHRIREARVAPHAREDRIDREKNFRATESAVRDY